MGTGGWARLGRWARAWLAVLGALVVLPAAAGGTALAKAKPSRPTVFAAASLTEFFKLFDPAARYNFAGSDQLAFQITQGAPADVFAAASPRYAQQLFAQGLVLAPQPFATNSVVLIVPRANPAAIASLQDLTRPGVRLVIGDAGVPVGDYTRTALARLGLQAALRNVVSNEPDVKGVVAKVALGEADAGFVYATDVRPVRTKVRVFRLPAEAQPNVEYQIAVVKSSRHLAAARAFLRRLLSPAGRRALVDYGFGVPAR